MFCMYELRQYKTETAETLENFGKVQKFRSKRGQFWNSRKKSKFSGQFFPSKSNQIGPNSKFF